LKAKGYIELQAIMLIIQGTLKKKLFNGTL